MWDKVIFFGLGATIGALGTALHMGERCDRLEARLNQLEGLQERDEDDATMTAKNSSDTDPILRTEEMADEASQDSNSCHPNDSSVVIA